MSYNNRDDIDKFYDYNIYLPTSTLYMGSVETDLSEDTESGTDAKMAEQVVKGLHILDLKDREINVIMNNLGGDWDHGMAIYDAIKKCKNHVTITVYGQCMSMGTVILQAADLRILAPNSRFMIHYGTDGFSGHAKNFEKWAEDGKRLNKKMEDIYLEKMRKKNPKYPRVQLKNMLNFDTIMTAEETVKLGLADKVLGHD